MALEIFKMLGTVAVNKDAAIKDLEAIKKKAEQTGKGMTSSFQKFGNFVQKNSAQIKAVGKSMTVMGGIASAAFGMAVKTAAGFEQSMANVQSVAGATSEELQKLSDYAREMGEQSIYSASQAADAMYYLASAGMDTNEIMGALEGTLTLAAATQSDLAFVSEKVAAALSQFQLEATEADRVANVFAATISGSQATMEKLGTSMSYVGPMAKAMGIEIEEVCGILGNLYNAGYDGSMAGTALRMAFTQLLKPTDDAQAALEKLGVSINDSQGEMKDFSDIIDELGAAHMSATDAVNIFGQRAGPAMLALVGQGEGAIRKMTDAVTGTEKATEMAAIQLETFQGQLTILKSAAEELMITIGTQLLPVLTSLVEDVQEVVNKLTDWAKANPGLTEKIVKWGAGLSAALLVIGPLVALLPSFVAGIRLLSSAFVPFLVGGAIALGFKKLLDYFDELSEKAYKAKVNLNELSIAQLDAEIQRTKTEIEKARKELETMMNLPLAQSAAHGGAKAIEDTIKRLQNELRILEEQRASLNVTEEEATKIGEEESKIRKTLDEIMAQYSDEVENAKGKIESETESKIKMLSVSEKLAHQINILNAEYELTKKELEDTEKYYQDRIALTEEYVAALEKEKQGLIEGSQERAQVELQILSAKNEIQDYKEKLKELTEVESNQLEGLELVNAQLGVLENKYSDVTKSEEYFTEKAELLTKQQELLNEKLEEAEPNSEEFFEYTNKLIENKRAIEDNIKAEEEFNKVHDLSLKGIDLVNAQLSLLEKQYKNTGDEIAYTEEKTRLLQEKADLLTAALDELEKSGGFQTEEWFALQEAIEETKNQMEELTDSTNDAENVWADFFTNLQSSYGTAISNMQTAIQQFTSSFQSALSDAITSLFTMKEQNNRIKDEIAQKEEEHKTTMQKLQEEYNEAVMNGNDVLAAKIQQNMQDEEDKHKELIEGMKDDYVTTQSIAEKFWSALKTAAINALAEMIAKQITSALLSLVTANPILALAVLGIGLFTWLASQVGGVGTGGNVTPGAEYSSSGGAVSSIQSVANFMKGGMVEYLQAGGPKGTDTVNTWLTPGEYVISKPMTDFIRRTGVVTSDLVNAIRMGNVTPAPTFAGEGAVSPELGSLEIGSGVTIEELNVAIYAQTLDENAISEAGPKIFSEFQKQLEMRGLALTEV